MRSLEFVFLSVCVLPIGFVTKLFLSTVFSELILHYHGSLRLILLPLNYAMNLTQVKTTMTTTKTTAKRLPIIIKTLIRVTMYTMYAFFSSEMQLVAYLVSDSACVCTRKDP